jgi:type IV pilus assembly protein PilM
MAFDLGKLFASLQTKKILAPTKVVGIDFGSASVKVVELEKREDGVALTTYGELQLGPYAGNPMGSAVKLSLQKKTEALVDVLRESGVTAKDAVFALPLSDSFITVMSLPIGKDENIAARVHVEARKYIPIPINDVTLEWTEVTQETAGAASLVHDVLLVAIQNQSVADTRTLLDSVGSAAAPAEIELFSCMRAVSGVGDTSLAVMDFGGSVSKLYIAESGVLQRLHRVQSGGTHATQKIATELAIAVEDAENRKRNYSLIDANSANIKSIVEQTGFRALQEFKRVLDQYETRVNRKIERVVITGGVTLFPEFDAFVSYTLSREVSVVNGFKKVASPAFMEDTLQGIAPTFTTALGAALRQFEI